MNGDKMLICFILYASSSCLIMPFHSHCGSDVVDDDWFDRFANLWKVMGRMEFPFMHSCKLRKLLASLCWCCDRQHYSFQGLIDERQFALFLFFLLCSRLASLCHCISFRQCRRLFKIFFFSFPFILLFRIKNSCMKGFSFHIVDVDGQ